MNCRHHSTIISAFLLIFLPLTVRAQSYEIGHISETFFDPDRGDRSILTEIYYPAESPGDDVPPAVPGGEGFPVVAFGHGYLMGWDSYENVWTALVPAGYIVALPRTAGELFPDHLEFGLDLAFLVRRMQEEGDDPGSPFFAKVGPRSAVAGHSMGGGASLLAAAEDPEITAVFGLAPAETNPSAIEAASSIDAHALIFAGSFDCVAPPALHQLPMYDALGSNCRTYIEIDGASHCQFAGENFLCSLGEIGCDDPLIGREFQHALVESFLLLWLDFVLREDGSGWHEFLSLMAESDDVVTLQDCLIVRTGRTIGRVR